VITRNTILDLANQAAQENNRPLRELLLTVAGMLDMDGDVVVEPEPNQRWVDVFDVTGAYGVGLHYLQCRQRELAEAKNDRPLRAGTARLVVESPAFVVLGKEEVAR
jgi:hypothetical protein